MKNFFKKHFGCNEGVISCSLSLLTAFVQRHAYLVLILSAVLTLYLLFYIVNNFRINSNLDDMLDNELPFRQLALDYDRAFDNRGEIVIVLDGDTPETAAYIQKLLANKLKDNKKLFYDVYLPDGGSFFEKNGLLYLSVKELQDLSDRMAEVQPLMGMVSQDMTLRGFFSMLETIFKNTDDIESYDERFISMFNRLSEAFEAVTASEPTKPYHLSWQALMFDTNLDTRRFIIVQPDIDYSELLAGKKAIDTIRDIAAEFTEGYGVEARITGSVALENDDLLSVQKGTVLAAVVSLALVRIILSLGLGSRRLILFSLIALFVGLIWTTGFAIAFIGSLNLISISFAILFIGLGIDFSIQFSLRYRELLEKNNTSDKALVSTAKTAGSSLLLCAFTSAIGFYSFAPTAYLGISELGIISGTGMFISFFANLLLLPAFLTIMPVRSHKIAPFKFNQTISMFPYKYARSISFIAILLGIGSAFLIPRVYFDYNPINLNDPDAESVKTVKELFKDGRSSPWKLSILEEDKEKANKLKKRLTRLEDVEMAITIDDFVPENQEDKLYIIDGLALFIPPLVKNPKKPAPTFDENMAVLTRMGEALRTLILFTPRIDDSENLKVLKRFYHSINNLKEIARHSPTKAEFALEQLDRSLLMNLSFVLNQLRRALKAEAFGVQDLPKDLRSRYVAKDGRYRIEVSPRYNITENENLELFVDEVRAIAPNSIGSPVMILESGRVIIQAFKEATLYAVILITIIIVIMLRSFSETLLILVPLGLAVLYTASASVLLDIPLNFANVIVVPLILGVGVDIGVHFIHRFHTDPPSSGNILMTSTARGVFYSALTTLVSFGSLAFSAHRGTASMGQLLVLCMSFMLISTLIVLPALLKLFKGHRGYPEYSTIDNWMKD